MTATLHIKRVYEAPSPEDGSRVLVDRIWPRGVSRDAAALDLWLKDIAPSTELRKWFGHEPARFAEFCDRYHKELDANREAVAELLAFTKEGKVTLLYSAHDQDHNNAVVLAEYLKRKS